MHFNGQGVLALSKIAIDILYIVQTPAFAETSVEYMEIVMAMIFSLKFMQSTRFKYAQKNLCKIRLSIRRDLGI